MYQFPIGVILDSFRLDIPSALKKAVEDQDYQVTGIE